MQAHQVLMGLDEACTIGRMGTAQLSQALPGQQCPSIENDSTAVGCLSLANVMQLKVSLAQQPAGNQALWHEIGGNDGSGWCKRVDFNIVCWNMREAYTNAS